MGFLQPNLPIVDMAEWSKGTRASGPPDRQHMANGYGAPDVVYLATGQDRAFVLGGMLFACPPAASTD